MPDDNEFERWMKIAEWRGKTVQALEDIDKDLIDIKRDLRDIKKQNIKRDVRTAEIAGGMAILIVVVGYVIQNFIS